MDQAADELYGLPLDEFTQRRDELARALHADGRQEDAAAVKRMPKPTLPAWVVNRLARERKDEVRDLLAAGDELRRVQEWLLRREADPGDLRTAVEAERDAVARLVRAGAELLADAGRAPRGDVLERIGETLHAAAADPDMRADLVRGRVVRDQAAVGLGGAVGAAPAGATRRATRRATRGGGGAGVAAGQAEARQRAAEAAREELRAAEAEAKAAARMRDTADRAVERALRALDAAEETWNRAGDDLRAAREELGAAQKSARAARDAAEAAEAEAVDRRRRADSAGDGEG